MGHVTKEILTADQRQSRGRQRAKNSDGTIKKYKARFVARGFSQTKGVDYKETWSPVINMKSIRTILAMAAAQDLDLYQDDVGTAYLKSMGFRQLEADPCVYRMSGMEELHWILGMQIKRERQTKQIWVDQNLANGTRPDISTAVSEVCRYMANPGEEHWIAVKRIMRYLNQPNPGIRFDGRKGMTLWAHCDSDFAGDLDKRRSRTGYVTQLGGGPVSWKSKHITRDSVESGATKLVRVDSKENTADLLTKSLPEEGHTRLRARLLGTTA